MTRVITLMAMATLAAFALCSPSDSGWGFALLRRWQQPRFVVRGSMTGKFMWTLLFLGVLSVFTPFHQTQFSGLFISILDMATLALLVASPIVLGRSTSPFVLKHAGGSVAITRH